MSLLESLQWRYATKRFDSERPVEPELIHQLKEGISLSASSLGLQPYKILEIENPDLRYELYSLCWEQVSIIDAPHLFLFCNMTRFSNEYLDFITTRNSEAKHWDEVKKQSFRSIIHFLEKENGRQFFNNQTSNDVHVALGIALACCADLKLDSCPINGFQYNRVKKLLHLEAKNLEPAAFLAVGYRSSEDETQFFPKVRKPIDDLFEKI